MGDSTAIGSTRHEIEFCVMLCCLPPLPYCGNVCIRYLSTNFRLVSNLGSTAIVEAEGVTLMYGLTTVVDVVFLVVVWGHDADGNEECTVDDDNDEVAG